jgi:glycosyltransferase involved in cell wall biosynthesis
VVSRLAPEKGVADGGGRLRPRGPAARRRRRRAGAPAPRALAAQTGADVRLAGASATPSWPSCARGAAVALVPSRAAETFGLAAAEAMAAGLPVAATAAGAVAELVDADGLVPVGDVAALASAARARWGDAGAGDAGLARIRAVASPEVVSTRLAAVYAAAVGEAPGPDRSAVRP